MPRVLALLLLGVIALLFWLSGCASTPRHFSTAPVLWTDDDRRDLHVTNSLVK